MNCAIILRSILFIMSLDGFKTQERLLQPQKPVN